MIVAQHRRKVVNLGAMGLGCEAAQPGLSEQKNDAIHLVEVQSQLEHIDLVAQTLYIIRLEYSWSNGSVLGS